VYALVKVVKACMVNASAFMRACTGILRAHWHWHLAWHDLRTAGRVGKLMRARARTLVAWWCVVAPLESTHLP